jgi:Family of unknown function (DUF5947)
MSDPLAVLQRIRRQKEATAPRPGEVCDICAEPIPDEHAHVVDLNARNLICACRGCYLLFTADGAGGGHYRAVPDRYQKLAGFGLASGQWEALQIPVGVAFFFFNSSLGHVVAFYPSPAGATESELSLGSWAELEATHPALTTLEPDVEAVLVRTESVTHRAPATEAYIVPIDACYELVGQMRRLWRGFDGGQEAHDAIDLYFDRLQAKAR